MNIISEIRDAIKKHKEDEGCDPVNIILSLAARKRLVDETRSYLLYKTGKEEPSILGLRIKNVIDADFLFIIS